MLKHESEFDLNSRFPSHELESVGSFAGKNKKRKKTSNPAITLYGSRFYSDQTLVEYLSEFLLVFASPKAKSVNSDNFRFKFNIDETSAYYYPEDRLALKLFAFFPNSKLATRHEVHRQAYSEALDIVERKIEGTASGKKEAIRLLQSLFSGFVGVAQDRTWVVHSFLPVSYALLGREIDWLHSKAIKDNALNDWKKAYKYFDLDRHNFMARGGELLFLQLAHLFSVDVKNNSVKKLRDDQGYSHIKNVDFSLLKKAVEEGLWKILHNSVSSIDELSNFIENTLSDYKLGEIKPASLGWVPTSSVQEAFLFAYEIKNICDSVLGELEKIDLLQVLCCMQVLRSLSSQAKRFDKRLDHHAKKIDGFYGNYVWITASPDAGAGTPARKLAMSSFEDNEKLLYGVLRSIAKDGDKLGEADDHGFKIFRKLAKKIGLVVPRTGSGERFVLPPHLLRFLVAALLRPGERVRLTEFYARVFAHYGIALGERQLATALAWTNSYQTDKDYAISADTTWIEEALRQGGFLMELSDAVSIVHNPGRAEY